MQLLEEKIKKEGKILPGNVVKIDGFLNHRVDTDLLKAMAKEFCSVLNIKEATAIVTAAASGIAIATAVAMEAGLPLIYAKKGASSNISSDVYSSMVTSFTYGRTTNLSISKQWLTQTDKVIIIDDFMAYGNAMNGLIDIINQSKATILGIGIAVEKGFQGGGDKLRAIYKDRYQALAVIEEATADKITFRS